MTLVEPSQNNRSIPKPKEPLVALLLSVFLFGLGHLYAGKPKRGWTIMATTIICPLIVIVYGYHPTTKFYPVFFLIYPLMLAFFIFVMVDAYNAAVHWNRQNNLARRINMSQKIGLIMGTLLVFFVFNVMQLLSYPIASYVHTHVAQAFKIPASGMEPTLLPDDKIFVDPSIYKKSDPKRGDILAFKHPEKPNTIYVQRLAGLPGETLEIKDGRLIINGATQNEGPLSKIHYENSPSDYAASGQKITIPLDSYFVLGDNPPKSPDSRNWGFLPKQNVIGKVYKIFWPFSRSGKLE